ncbi:DHH family protein [Spiroplasma sabaudiense Ar-1343]|uniref:DHH family protein n=1 Tax=Spiroplasma sabaudiense Ar-1343 TaxID=1276257 RepID=W6AB15_9MOLU|nr:bifunctional oligoribonuclease/PAP phosphatase NrnA [Spiroplasma sabaudiense]AHI54217.1 DHH family protein [Spiroplasma sabaudiense Ar-1343]
MNPKYKILFDKIKEYEAIVIAKHVNPDFDAIGSAYGLKILIDENFKNKKVYVVGSNIDDSKILNPDLTDEVFSKALLITCDTANLERVDFDNFDKVKEVFKIDHHVDGENFGNYKLVDVNAIACCQVIAHWAMTLNLKISKGAATHLYKGIVTDSNRFMYKNTSAQTFLVAAELMNCGIDLNEIYDSLYIRKLKIQKWINNCFQKAVFDSEIAHIKIYEKDYQNLNLTLDEIKSPLGSICGIEEIKVSILATEIDGVVKVSLRSKKIPINEIAKNHGGGGHHLAAACKLSNWKEFETLLLEVKELIARTNL